MRERLAGLGAAARGILFKAAVTISLIPGWMAGVSWQMLEKFLSLVSEGYKKNAVVYACIRVLAASAGEPLLKIYRPGKDGKLEDLPEHPLFALLQRPNPLMTGFEFIELMATHLSICGQTYWWKERSNANQVIGLWPLRPDRIEPILGTGTGDLLRGWRYWLDGASFTLPAKDVFFVNYPDPGDETGGILGGLGPLQVLAREVDTDNEATSFVYAMLKNYAMPGVVIQSKAKLNKKEAEELRSKFEARYGDMNRGKPAIIDADTTIATLSHNMRDMTFPDVRSLGEARIAAAFGVPAILVGLKVGLDRSTFSNMAEAREYFAETTLSVLWRRLADQVTADLLADFGERGLVALFDTSTVRALQGQQREKAKRYEVAFIRGGITVDEYRQHALGLDALPMNGDVLYLPNAVTVTIVADLGKPKPPPVLALPPGKPPPEGDDPPEDDPPPGKQSGHSLAALSNAGRSMREAKSIATARRRMAALSDEATTSIAAYFAGLGGRILARLESQASKGLDDDDWVTEADSAAFTEVVRAAQLAAVTRAGSVAAVELGLEGAWTLPPTDALALVDELGTRIRGIDTTTRQQVRAALAAGLAEGEGIPELATRIRKLVDESWPSRAATIARTETATAYNKGAILAYERSGLVEEVECLDGGDCGWTSHQDPDRANGTRRTLKEASQYPICHPNCLVGDTEVVAPNLEVAFARRYEGEVISIRTETGEFLTATPNHPILTPRGWVAAGELNEGDEVIRSLDSQDISHMVAPDDDYVPASIEDVANTLLVASGMTARTMPSTAEDFHGDGGGSEVYVELANGELGDGGDATLRQPSGEHPLTLAIEAAALLSGSGASQQLVFGPLDAAHGFMGGVNAPRAFFGGEPRVEHDLALAGAAEWQASTVEGTAHVAGLDSDSRRDLVRRLACEVASIESMGVFNRLAAQRDVALVQDGTDTSAANAETQRDLTHRLSCLVEATRLVSVERHSFRGHVYNLQTAQHWYIAGGIITHNCVRAFAPIVSE